MGFNSAFKGLKLISIFKPVYYSLGYCQNVSFRHQVQSFMVFALQVPNCNAYSTYIDLPKRLQVIFLLLLL